MENQIRSRAPEDMIEDSVKEIELCTHEIMEHYRTMQIFQIDFTMLFTDPDLIVTKEDEEALIKEVSSGLCSPEELKILAASVKEINEHLAKTKASLAGVYAQLRDFVQHQACTSFMNPSFQDPANKNKINTLLTELQTLYKQEWAHWVEVITAMAQKMPAKRAATLFINRHKFLESANILNTIWLSLNRSQVQGANWTPASRPLLPIPFSINNPFGSYLT